MSLSNVEINRYLHGYPVDLQDIFLEARNLVIAALPEVKEHITWYGVAYYRPVGSSGGGPEKTGICYLAISDEFVEIGFLHGDRLPDPDKILQGKRKGKRIAHFEAYDRVPWDALEKLVSAAVAVEARSIQ